MSNIQDNILLADFGLDSDTANRYKAKGSSGYFLNVLKGEDGAYGELTNLKGNRKITYPLGDSNTYFTVWSCYDGLTRNVYFYIFSQPYDITGSGDYEYDNRFIRFNEDTEVITTMFYDTKNYFGVDPNIRVKDSFVLGDWLYYNPQTSEPKVICLSMILNYTEYDNYDATLTYAYGDKRNYFGGTFLALDSVAVGESPVSAQAKWLRIGDCYQDQTDIEFDSEFRYAFNVIKHIPVYRPTCTYATDPDKNANNVRAKLFRFSHRYKYFDNSFSRYSAFSDITLPQYDEYYNGEVPGDLDQFNCIDVNIRLHSPALVKEIDIIFQETGGDWKRAKVINRRDITLLDDVFYTYRFYNTDSAYENIDDSAFSEAYDAVPKKANAQEIINKNMICYGGCTEGFTDLDKNDIDVILTPEIEAITIPDSVQTIVRDSLANGDNKNVWDEAEEKYKTEIDIAVWFPNGIAAGDIFKVNIGGIERQYLIQLADVAGIVPFLVAISTFLDVNYPTLGWGSSMTHILSSTTPNIISFIFYSTGTTQVALTKKSGFKTGAWHPFCIYYYDEAMRRWDAQTSKDSQDGLVAWAADGTTVYVPMLGEYSPTPATTAYKWNINWEINHLPPEGAKWWRWGYAGNALASKFVQYIVETIEDETPLTRLNITPLQTIKTTTELTWNQFPQSVIDSYSWTKGDRVRIITQASAGNNMGAVIDGVYDFEILKYDDSTAGEYWIYTQDFDYTSIGAGAQTLVELYTPIKTDTAKIFHEFGELMPIIEDSDGVLVHGAGNTGLQNQDTLLTDPAQGVFEAGDVYHILRTPSMPISTVTGYFHESQWYSDFYDSDDWDKGRIGVETQFGERKLNIVRHSNQYLQNTMINGLPTFHGIDYKELNDVFGDIKRIIESGDTLKVYQRKKPSSILIGRTEYTDAAGNSNIVEISDRVFGSIRYSSTNYGTEFAESIERNNRYVYGFDVYNGVLWRDSPNGIFPVSGRYESTDGGGDYKMESYFKEKAKALLVSGIDHVEVLTVWDEKYKNLYVIFKDSVSESNDEALMFHEPSNRWICFTNMDQTPTEGWNQILELTWSIVKGFDGGIGFSFDEDTRFAVFNIGNGLGTSGNISLDVEDNPLVLSINPPTSITCTADVAPDEIGLVLTIPTPSIAISGIYSNDTNMEWDAEESGIGERIDATFTLVFLDSGVLTSFPSWLNIYDTTNLVSVGYEIANGTVLGFAPSTNNTGLERLGYVVFTDANNNTEVITVRQLISITIIIATVSVDPTETNGLVIYNANASTDGVNISLTFEPNHPSLGLGEGFVLDYTVLLNGNPESTGYFSTTNQMQDTLSIPTGCSPVVGDVVSVYLKTR